MIEYSIQPWEIWPRKETPAHRRGAPFTQGYQQTLNQLDAELTKLKAKDIVLQLKVKRGDIRLDGGLRQNATTSHPGVILSFKRDGRTITMPCDACTSWQQNLRAIALTLERLRLADLYGVTQSGEQYRGWEALPPPGAVQVMTKDAAADLIAKWSGVPQDLLLTNPRMRTAAIKEARFAVHPDKGAKAEDAAQVSQAAGILEEL